MKIFRHFPPPPTDSLLSLVIGNFDGVHIGHRYLLEQAKAQGGILSVMTFEPHPLAVLRPDKTLFRIGGIREKIHHLANCGVEHLYMLRFNPTLAKITARDFAELLFAQVGVKQLIVGSNFRFGRAASGDCDLLRQVAARHKATVHAITLYQQQEQPVSSGRIRDYLNLGQFDEAEKLLGQRWILSGRVCQGEGLGHSWGVPTANLRLSFVPPCAGVFVAEATVAGGRYPAAVSIGVNPTVQQDNIVRVEAHLLDFSANIYGARLTLNLLAKLREEKQFSSIPMLKDAIADDIRQTKHWFACR